MAEKAFSGDTTQRVETYPDGSHALVVKVIDGAAAPASSAATESWVDVEYETDPQGRVVREKQKNVVTSATREHTITYTTALNGNEVTLIGDWV